ncbi:protease complex subunit PrcB family protein [Candidatus Competibacter phosphatis]|uniref:Protease complex subunit PrcB family protein n=1 Tax=Candidatus Competibacter phosphatis TaxID=221280 RepID=A0ABX1TRB5_9GAMM|nr:protease complex subunit PrcB family protein [Candidatus Competibacter phosphatis]NMQ21212.1 protease complex subunit PrcB family protein [Candidatus Competibacter phosphatis]
MRRSRRMLAALALLSGCAQTGAGEETALPVESLYGGSQCGGLERPIVIWIANAAAWRSWHGRIVSPQMSLPSPPMVDFSREGVLLVAMGTRPSAGYGLSLAGESATVRDGVLSVRVDWREPPPGYRQAQVVTSPCLALKVPAVPFARITVLDLEGRVRLEGVR